MNSKKWMVKGSRVFVESRCHRGITVFPVRKVSLLRVKDFFTGVKAVAMPVMVEYEHIRVVHDLNFVMPSQ